jgi:diguanylate cyclase (GGDEF)-like protein
LRNLAYPALPRLSPDPASFNASDEPRLRLKRLCERLGVASAQLTDADQRVLASVGPRAHNLTTLRPRAGETLVLADSGAEGHERARFYVGLPWPVETDGPPLLLSLFDPAPRAQQVAERIARLAQADINAAFIARQRQVIARQARSMANEAVGEHQWRLLFERAAATARIGIWQCDLADERLTWSDGVYDLFEYPHDVPLTRASTLALYTEKSRREIEAARSAAIANCSEFALDCEITTTTGKRRWMRLTGAVESRDGVATRIFGVKQDVTEEKLLADRMRYLAEFDVMTALANRSQFQARLAGLDAGQGGVGAMLLIDLDGFKQVNDTYGHASGDECIRAVAECLRQCCVDAELVARIGGDEFAVLLGETMPPDAVEALARAIVDSVARLQVAGAKAAMLGASVGVAHYRGGAAETLFQQADTALYAAKAAGRNTSRTYRD